MSTVQHRLPSIAATSTSRNAFGRESHTIAKGWAGRSDLSDFTNDEISHAHDTLLKNAQALKPFYSPERTAYRKLQAEMQRRHLLTDPSHV